MSTKIKVGQHTIEITHGDKILFPHSGITKTEFVNYYYRIAPIMLPYLKNRPLTMLRYVNGIGEDGFYQKDVSSYFPSWIKRVTINKRESGAVHYMLCDSAAALVYIANQLCITPHVWLSHADKLDNPDRIIFDLDPGIKTDFAVVRITAKKLKKILEAHGLTPFVMTTGSKGLHVVVPIKPTHDFDHVRAFARSIAQELVEQDTKRLTLETRKAKRRGRLYVDVMRNAFGQTGVAPYAVRAREGAPVATPIDWSELTAAMHPRRYTIKNIFKRLARKGDVWHDMQQYAVALP